MRESAAALFLIISPGTDDLLSLVRRSAIRIGEALHLPPQGRAGGRELILDMLRLTGFRPQRVQHHSSSFRRSVAGGGR